MTHVTLTQEVYTFITDPGHGWLQVPLEDVHALGIADKISRYSYVDQKFAYLEEDVDAGRFIEALKENHIEFQYVERHTDYDSPVRTKARFTSV